MLLVSKIRSRYYHGSELAESLLTFAMPSSISRSFRKSIQVVPSSFTLVARAAISFLQYFLLFVTFCSYQFSNSRLYRYGPLDPNRFSAFNFCLTQSPNTSIKMRARAIVQAFSSVVVVEDGAVHGRPRDSRFCQLIE